MPENPHWDAVGPPPLKLFVQEQIRAVGEFANFRQRRRLLSEAPRGDGHPVLVMPGFLAPEFSTYPRQDAVRAVFVPLARLQRDLGQEGKVNTVLVGASLETTVVQERLRTAANLSDLGVRVRVLEAQEALSVESDALMLSESIVSAARAEAAARNTASRPSAARNEALRKNAIERRSTREKRKPGSQYATR